MSNSEVGWGAFTITPQLVVQVRDNGLTIGMDVVRAIHAGSRMAEGGIYPRPPHPAHTQAAT